MVGQKNLRFGLAVVSAIWIIACDGGLKPPPETPLTTISGTITYVGGGASWPRPDSVVSLRAAAFTTFPPADIVSEVLQKRAYFTPEALSLDSTLPRFVASSAYRIVIPDPAPARVEYIAVAMLTTTNSIQLLQPQSWKVIGIYSLPNDPKRQQTLALRQGSDHTVNITVDFKNLPPQPF